MQTIDGLKKFDVSKCYKLIILILRSIIAYELKITAIIKALYFVWYWQH